MQVTFLNILRYFFLPFSFIVLVSAMRAQSGNPAITTGQYDANRSSANLNETTLNTVNVNVNQFGKLFSWAVDGWIFAQPLYVPGVLINGSSKNVVYAATMNNSIYAFDADNPTAAPIWHSSFGAPVVAPTTNACPNVQTTGPLLGILSTPVIDRSSQTLYAVSASPTGITPSTPHGAGYLHYLHAVDITNGQERPGSPVSIQATVAGNGYDAQGGLVSLNMESKVVQRTALLLAGETIYAGFGNCGPDSDPWHGWVVGYSASDLNQMMVFNSTPNSGQGGIWQSGRGLATDNNGDLYFNTGNATSFTSGGVTSSVTTGNSATDAQQGNFPMRIVQMNAAGQFLSSFPPANYAALNAHDLDFSSSGPLTMPGTNLLVTGGKDGVIYLFSSSNLSSPLQSFQATGGSTCNYSFDGCSQIHDLAFWNNTLYVWGAFDILRAYTFSTRRNRFDTPATARGRISVARLPSSLAISANNSQSGTGILWAVLPDNSVHAFRADNVSTEIWNSNQNPGRDALPSYPKFTEPTVANGRVYVATHSNQLVVYGLLSDFTISASVPPSVNQGGFVSSTVNITALRPLSAPVVLSVAGLPAGATATFAPASLASSGSSTLTISTTGTTLPGTYSLIVSGTEGTALRATNVLLTVTTSTRTRPQAACCTAVSSGVANVLGLSALDSQSGLRSIQAVEVVNADVSIPSFKPGTTSKVDFTETLTGAYSYVLFKLTNQAGNVSYINPIWVDAARAQGRPLGYSVKNLGPELGWLTIQNGSPGIKSARIEIINGPDISHIEVGGLKDGETRVINLSPYLQTGSAANITPLGRPQGDALFTFGSSAIADIP